MESRFFIYMTLHVLLLSVSEGSDIIFNSTRSSILPPVTKEMRLSCLLEDNSLKTNNIIGKRSITHTDQDVGYLTSVVVIHNGQDIASITEHVPAQVLNGATNMKVTGQVQGSHGFIQIDWLYPNDADSGEYQCDVTGVSKKGHSFVFSKTLEVSAADVTVSDLAAEVALLKKNKDAMQVENTTMHNLISSLTSDKNSLRNDVTKLQADKTTMQGQITTMTNQITALTNEKNALKTRMAAAEAKLSKTRSVRRTSCHWTSSWVNSWDAEFSYTAPGNAMLVGVHSRHDNGKEDRVFQFEYCNLEAPHA